MTKPKAQVAIEFVISFICALLFLLATTQIFVWFGGTIVNRHKAYEATRTAQVVTINPSYPSLSGLPSEYKVVVPPPEEFYTPEPLDIFGVKKTETPGIKLKKLK